MVFHWEKQKENLKNGLLRGLFLLCCGEYIYNRKKKLGCLPIYKALPRYVIYPSAFCSCRHSFAHLQMKVNEFWKWEETCWSQRSEFASEALDSASCDSRLLQGLGEWVLHVKCWVWVSVNGAMTSVDLDDVTHLYCYDCDCDHGPSPFPVVK